MLSNYFVGNSDMAVKLALTSFIGPLRKFIVAQTLGLLFSFYFRFSYFGYIQIYLWEIYVQGVSGMYKKRRSINYLFVRRSRKSVIALHLSQVLSLGWERMKATTYSLQQQKAAQRSYFASKIGRKQLFNDLRDRDLIMELNKH